MNKVLWVILISTFLLRISSYFLLPNNYKVGDRVRITSRLLKEPAVYDDRQQITVENFRVYLPIYPKLYYGDQIIIEGIVDEKQTLSDPKLIQIKKSGNIFFLLRERLLGVYKKVLPIDEAALVSGITIGSKQSISTDFWEKLKNSGTAHVVVASGMNVTLVAGFLISFLTSFLSRKIALLFAISGIWAYALISGFDAPIVRASIMGTIAFSAQKLGRVYFAKRALIITGVVMILINPGYLVDYGFILSFVATASLMLFESKVNRLIYFVPSIFREGLSTSIAAQIGVAPVLFLLFNQFNLLSPIVNGLVLWVIGPATILALAGGLVALVIFPIGKLMILLGYPLYWFFVEVVYIFG